MIFSGMQETRFVQIFFIWKMLLPSSAHGKTVALVSMLRGYKRHFLKEYLRWTGKRWRGTSLLFSPLPNSQGSESGVEIFFRRNSTFSILCQTPSVDSRTLHHLSEIVHDEKVTL